MERVIFEFGRNQGALGGVGGARVDLEECRLKMGVG